MLKISISQLYTTVNKLDDRRDIASRNIDINSFGSKYGSNKKLSKSRKSIILDTSGITKEPKFPSFSTRKTFNLLQQAFIKALILQYLDLECHIQIKTNASGYTIGGVLSQLTFD